MYYANQYMTCSIIQVHLKLLTSGAEVVLKRISILFTCTRLLALEQTYSHPYPLPKNGTILKWYYDQKIISFFSSDFESVFA